MHCVSANEPDAPAPESKEPIKHPIIWNPPLPLALDTKPFPTLPIVEGNPLSSAGVALGKALFYDPILSLDSSISCASCHNPSHAFSDRDMKISHGVLGRVGSKNAPALFNLAWAKNLFWDGRATGLEKQALGPIEGIQEMALPWEKVRLRLSKHSTYNKGFYNVFGKDSIDSNQVTMAIAQYERTLISANSRYDKWKAARIDFTDEEYQGYEIFNTEAGECFHCHSEPFFTNFGFHNIGLDSLIVGQGLGGITGNAKDMGKWKVPSLRNLAFTAPYMHDGRFASLNEVIDFYQSGGHYSATLDPLIRNPQNPYAKYQGKRGLGLSDIQRKALLAFLATLNDSAFIYN